MQEQGRKPGNYEKQNRDSGIEKRCLQTVILDTWFPISGSHVPSIDPDENTARALLYSSGPSY